VNFTVSGEHSDKAVILVHGWMHSSRRWASLIEALEGQYCIYSPDIVGFGSSSNLHESNLDLATLSDLFAEFVLQVAMTRQIHGVVAHSMGGLVTLYAIDKIGIFAQSHFFCGVPVQKTSLLSTVSTFRTVLGFGHRLVKVLPLFISRPIIKLASLPTIANLNSADDTLVYDTLSADTGLAMHLLREISQAHIFDLALPFLPRAIVSRGEFDLIVDRQSGESLAKKLGGRYLEFARSGHTPHLEVAAEFNRTVVQNLIF
jgi:pimeloyl-ACP methyl ester carboxylesterase